MAAAFLLSPLMAVAGQVEFGPAMIQMPGVNTATTNLLIDATGEKAAGCWSVGVAGDITALHIRLGTVTTGQTLKLSLQNTDPATGDPDETVDQSCTVSVASTDDNTWKTCTLGAARTVARGDLLCGVAEYDSSIGNLNVLALGSAASDNLALNVYADLKAGAGPTWTKQQRTPILGVEYSGGVFNAQYGAMPTLPATVAVNTDTTPDELGNVWTTTAPVRLMGIAVQVDLDENADVILYDSGSSALATVTIDTSVRVSAGAGIFAAVFSSAQTLAANTLYRLVIKPTTTTSVTVNEWQLPVAAARGQVPWGVDMNRTERTDAGSWTDRTTSVVMVWPILDGAADDTGGGGGVKVHPGMTGGTRSAIDPPPSPVTGGRAVLEALLASPAATATLTSLGDEYEAPRSWSSTWSHGLGVRHLYGHAASDASPEGAIRDPGRTSERSQGPILGASELGSGGALATAIDVRCRRARALAAKSATARRARELDDACPPMSRRSTATAPVRTQAVDRAEVLGAPHVAFPYQPAMLAWERRRVPARPLEADVVGLRREHQQVLRTVVQAVAVDVVDDLASQQLTPDRLLCYQAVPVDVPMAPLVPCDCSVESPVYPPSPSHTSGG